MIEGENEKLKIPLNSNVKFGFEDLQDILNVLLSENGCPWDKKQTLDSLKQYLLEETYEVIESINKKDSKALCEEAGDVLFQLLFLSKLSEKDGKFNISDVIDGICRKMILRHTHIFGEDSAGSSDEVIDLWEKNKNKEKKYKSSYDKLNKVPKELPALIRAQKVLEKAEGEGLLIPSFEESVEIVENTDKMEKMYSKERKVEKYGELLFHMVNIFRYLQINAEFSLTNATETFINRFENIKE